MAVAPANAEAVEAWDGVLFDRFVQYRHLIVEGLGQPGEEALRWAPPRTGERVLDIGCGFGDTAQRLAEMVGPRGAVNGIDAAPRFIETARKEAAEAGVENVSFEVVDVEVGELGSGFDCAFSRFGTMFFANPAAAMRNVREALRPGGRLCMVVWRHKPDNPWVQQAELAVERFGLEETEEDEPTCGPGPFSMAGADTTSGILVSAGFGEIALRRCDTEIEIGRTLAEAVQFNLALGPAGEALRLAGEQADALRPDIELAVGEALEQFERDDGSVRAPASTWIVTARAPQST